MSKRDIDRLCKRHMAKLLSRLREAECPAIFLSDIKRQFHFLNDDLVQEIKCNISEDSDETYQKDTI